MHLQGCLSFDEDGLRLKYLTMGSPAVEIAERLFGRDGQWLFQRAPLP